MRDQQRQKLYAWQWKNIPNGERMELKECQTLINRICKAYKLNPPQITDGRGRRIACYEHWSHKIKLPVWARQTRTVIHECAHYVADAISRPTTIPSHGREFVGVYMYLLNRYQSIDIGLMTKTANAVNLDFTAAHNCKPRRTK